MIENNEDLDESDLVQLLEESSPNISHEENFNSEEANVSFIHEDLNRGLDLVKQVGTYFTNMVPSLERSTQFKRNLQ